MKIQNIEIADCLVRETEKGEHTISIHFSEVFDLIEKRYIKDVTLVISNWTTFTNKLYINNKQSNTPLEKTLNTSEFEVFEEMFKKKVSENTLILEGFSRTSGHWMEYIFENYNCEIISK